MNRRNFPKLKALLALVIFSLLSVGTVWAQNAPTVTTNDATGITAITAKGNGNVIIPNDNVVVTERGICWRTGNTNPTIDDAHLAIGAGPGYISGEMTNLTPSTQYSVRAYAKYRVNGNEQIAYAARRTFNTLAFKQPAVTSIDVIHIRNNSAVGVAQVTDQGNDPTIERGVCWSTTSNPTIAGSHASSGMGEGNYSVEMTGLQANTTYYMRAYATNHYNTSTTVYGEEKYFHTHVHMQNGTIDVGDGGFVFTDSDADVIYPGFWYNNYEDYSVVFVPENSANGVKIVFDSLLINNDMLYFYDGDIAPENLIGVYTCNEYHAYKHSDSEQVSVFGLGGNLFTVTSHSYMTVRFVSDYHWRDFGWRAHVTQATFAPQPPTVAKMACTDDTFVLLGTSKGKKSTTLKYSVGYGGTDPGAPSEIYEGTPFIINGAYPVKIKVMTEVVETAGGEVIPSAVKMYTFGDESKVIHPDPVTFSGPAEGTSTLTLSVVRPAALNDTWKILYTLDGTDPASSETAQAITSTTEDPTTYDVTTSGTVALPDFCLVKAVVQGTTCPNAFSAVSEFLFADDYYTLYLLPPTITFDGNGSTANTIITPPTPGCDIHYKVNGGPEQTYNGPFPVNANDRVEAWVTKAGAYEPSPHASATYLPGNDDPGSGTGLFGDVVYLDDREDHSLSYYSDGDQPVHSLHPVDVKITYFGNGTGTVSATNGPTPASDSWTADATTVQVGPNELGNQFVYYETLEAGGYEVDQTGYTIMIPDYAGTSHDYPYSLIPNPFSVRPKYESSGPSTSTVYVSGRSINNGGATTGNGLIRVDYIGADGTPHYWERTNNSGNVYTTITVLDGTTLTLTARGAYYNDRVRSNITARYDDANGTVIASVQCDWYGEQVTAQGTVGSAGGGADYRGFYAWRVKRLQGVTIRDAYGTTYGENSIIDAETRLLFHTENEYDNEVDFEALWAKAYVSTSNNGAGLNSNVSYERNFVVGVTQINALNVPATYSSYYPDGTPSQSVSDNVTLITNNNHGNYNNTDRFFLYADMKFENMNFSYNQRIVGNNHNLCFGRGINTINVPYSFEGVYTDNDHTMGPLDYTIRVESGEFNMFSFISDTYTYGNRQRPINGRYLVKGIMGSDYDRAQNDNSKLRVCCDYSNDSLNMNRLFLCYGIQCNSIVNKDIETFNLEVKGGTYQESYWEYGGNGRYDQSFYVGQNFSAGYPGVRYITVKGGDFGSMNGGRGTSNYDHDHVDPDVVASSIRIKGGTFHGSVFGGAADNMTPGSRRIVITGRQDENQQPTTIVQGWVAGGCNGTGENGGMGCIDGNSYIYVGGNTVVGSEPSIMVNGTEGGNVFGAGRGVIGYEYHPNQWTTQIIDQEAYVHISNVVVADDAFIFKDVYGGGFHGYVTDTSNVFIVGGTVGNNVYGGAYQHGHTDPIPATRVHIRAGNVLGSVFGGSNTLGNVGLTGADPEDDDDNNAIVWMSGGTVGTTGSYESGCVFGGSDGINTQVLSNTRVHINGGLVVNNVYGGGNLGQVLGKATVNIVKREGDDIGAQIGDVHSDTDPTKGNVYGGGKGLAAAGGNTFVNEAEVNIVGSYIMGSVFGGGENGHVWTNTVVNVNGGQVGGYPGEISGGEHLDCDNPYHGSVYGGGSGLNYVNGEMIGIDPEDGWVMGNSTVNIVSGAHVMRNVYGGSNVASVGQYQGTDSHGYPNAVPNTGLATVNISGGIIGTDGHNKPLYNNGQLVDVVSNGMVFGSSHGKAVIGKKDYAHVNETHVIIAAGADIRGSVFGGGDDGFVLGNTLVEIIDGTIGNSLTGAESEVDQYGAGQVIYTGNVYGGGRGIDLENGKISTNAGFVKGNTEVRMTGGLVRHNVYGGGSLANIGFEDSKATTGRATVHISGGQVGSTGLNNGRVFGSGRGMPADPNNPELSKYADLSNANITFVTIDGVAKVMGSVFGGGENGHVLSKTFVTIDDQATIGSDYMHPHTGNVYGGGRGVDRYDSGSGLMFSRTAGKVYESTDVRVKNGLVYHHVYGGGDMASVGLHDEIDQNDFPTFANDDEEKAFGRATVEVSGGVIGIDGNSNGHVFGSSHGWAGAAFKDLAYTRYTDVTITGDESAPTLVHGSVFGSGEDGHVLKDTHVTIEAGCTIGTNGHTGYEGNVFGGGRGTDLDETGHLSPTAGKTFGNTVVDVTGGWVKGSVFGGGRVASVGLEDEEPDDQGLYHTGHTLVTISGGEIGTLTTDHPDETVGGNVYGGGKGFAGAPYKNFTYTKNTEVHIKDNAKIHGSVFGAGEDGHTRQTTHVYIEGGTIGDRESECTDRYHGNVYGGGRGIDKDEDGNFSWTAGRANWSAEVNVSGGRVNRNVYGGGNIASVGMVLIDPDADTVMLRPNGISTRAPYDVVPIDKFGQPRYTYEKDSDGNITWADEPNPLYGTDPTTGEYSDDNLTGWARVNITGGVIGSIEDQDHEHGNVFGSCHGKAGLEYQHLSYVTNTDVHVDYGQVDEDNIIQGSVFGGGEDGHVIMNTKVTVNAGKIGNMENDDLKGNVYGGGRGVDEDENHEMSPSAGLVKGHTRVYINGGYISNSVFAGANMSAVWQEKVVNINGGEVKGSVYGGSKNVPLNRLRRGLKTVNVRNGHIYGNVYGCSQASRDGSDEAHPVLGDFSWTAFVNISGGLIDGNVHGAGYHSLVNGSTSIHIGKNAILYAKNHPENLYYNDRGGEEPDPVVTVVNGITTVEPKVDNPLIIHGSVYGGSDYYGSTSSNDWSHYDVNGITNMIIDGKGYNTTVSGESTPKYMSIDGGLYGCSTHCESGTLGRHILLRNYGTRNVNATDLGNEMTSASRTLTTIQRCNDLIIDNANVNLSGLSDITGVAHRNYAVLKVDDTLYMANASALNLGTQTSPAYMDSIFAVRSLHLMNNDSVYVDFLYKVAHRDWEWIGVAPLNPTSGDIIDTINFNTKENARLYYRTSAATTALTYDKENVILFNGDSRLWVRYHKMVNGVNKQLYGELQGFFRMKSPFLPHGTESFAFARPKTTPNNNNLPQIQGQELYINLSDGGFLSYEIWKNFFTQKGNYGGWIYPIAGNDGGTEYTRTKQYPYTNVLKHSRGVDVEEYREWIIPMFTGKRWYVDGRGIGKGGWGIDKSHQYGWGHFPDMPKETVSGGAIAGDTLHMGGICYDVEEWTSGFDVFHPEEDIIYVVGPISADKENNTTTANNEVGPTEMNRWPEQYTLRLYRYPGGHVMSNGQIDNTVSTDPHRPVPDNTQYTGFGYSPSLPDTHNGPGANDTTMLIVEKDKSIILDNVYMDGLYGYDNLEVTYHMIPETTFPGELGLVTEPLVTTYPNSTLTMRGDQPEDEIMITKYGTVLRRGLNNLEAYDWYTNPDYNDTIHHGGGIYVNELARVEVEELVTVDDNLQTLNYPNEDEELISCNVYLPTFTKHVWMTNPLTDGTDIGITSPIRNAAWHYVHNTFSPVAVADKAGATDAVNDGIALLAYNNNNFFDDLEWFFVNNHRADNPKTTYYSTSIEDYEYNPDSDDDDVKEHFKPSKTLFFGWTWNNVVRRQPTTGYLNTTTDNFAFDNINSPEDLAWLISLVNGLNRQEANTLSGVEMIKQTEDVDMKQYVWLPVGAMKSGCLQFGGKYDGQGHLINHLDIAYIGLGDRRYERVNYGLFGGINQGKLNRTFLTSGFMKPVGATIIGGLSGTLVGVNSIISNSEASVDIHCFDNTNSVSGGLVGVLQSGEIHSSMAMPVLNAVEQGTLGGLVGKVEQNEFAKTVKNSFANAKFFVGDKDANKTFRGIAGGLIGSNYANVTNCYSHLVEYDGLGASFGSLIGESSGGSVTKCYASKQTYTTGEGSSQASYEFPLSHYVAPGEDPFVTNCYRYTPVKGADYFGYMYYDNVVEFGETESDVIPLFDTLNGWVDRNNADSKYAYWSRPTIPEINGDMPVLMLCDADGELPHQGSFRSLATYNGGHSQTGAFADNDTDYPGVVLQYGGPIRDGENNELDAALDREKVHTDMDYLFIYGDVINTIAADQIAATKGKVSVYEHAAINSPGTLAEFGNTYVGVTFDNSCGHAYSTPGINHLGNFILPRDWHMFSTPLSNAPLGFNYWVNGENTNLSSHYPENPTDDDVNYGDYYNNPWPNLHNQPSPTNGEFNWLNGGTTGNKRYWMKGWENSQSLNVENPGDYENEWADGYFPSRVDGASEFSNSCIETEDEYGRFPYGMDMFCWYEPEPHWINFKRNGPNHWHSDEYDGEQHLHAHLAYTENGISNQNEDDLVVGKGYMFSIAKNTYLQSHGLLNAVTKTRDVTSTMYINYSAEDYSLNGFRGWNLVGNPYHAYLDFEQFASSTTGNPLGSYYVIYDADGFKGSPTSAYLYYPIGGSSGGEYADQYLHPHQGFFVYSTGGTLTFDESMTVARDEATSAYRGWKPNYPLINLYLNSEKGCSDVTVIEFNRPEWGGATKQKALRNGNGSIYAYNDGVPYAALFAQEGVERVPLWFEADEDDVFTLTWKTANGDFNSLYLIDNLTGVRYDMLENDEYVFEGKVADYHSRFYITFNCFDVEENEDTETNIAFFDGSQWVVTGEGNIELIDLQGRVLWNSRLSGGQSRVSVPNVAAGLYLFRLTNANETKVQKIIIK